MFANKAEGTETRIICLFATRRLDLLAHTAVGAACLVDTVRAYCQNLIHYLFLSRYNLIVLALLSD